MKNVIRVTSLLISILLVTGMLLTGCGEKTVNQDSGTSGTSAATATAAATEEQALEPVDLKYYFVGSYPLKDQDEVYAECNKIIKQKINANVEFIGVNWGDYDQKMQTLFAAGDPFDLCFTSSWMNKYTLNVAKGALLPLDDLLDKYAPTIKGTVPQDLWDAVKVDGKIYGLINYQIMIQNCSTGINRFIGEKYGYDDAALRKLAADFKASGGDIGVYLPLADKVKADKVKDSQGQPFIPMAMRWQYAQIFYGFDPVIGETSIGMYRIKDEKPVAINQFDTDEYRNFIAAARKYKDYLGGEYVITDKNSGYQESNYKVAIDTITGLWKPGGEEEINLRFTGKENMVCLAPISDNYVTPSRSSATMTGINRNSKNPERAVMFCDLMYSDKMLYNLFTWGLEGKHYNKVEGDIIETAADSGYAPGTPWVFGNNFNSLILKGVPATVWEDTKKINAEAKRSKLLGFTFNADPVKAEVANCDAVIGQFLTAFNYGLLDVDKDYPKFIEKLKNSGADKVISEMNTQIDKFFNSK